NDSRIPAKWLIGYAQGIKDGFDGEDPPVSFWHILRNKHEEPNVSRTKDMIAAAHLIHCDTASRATLNALAPDAGDKAAFTRLIKGSQLLFPPISHGRPALGN